VKFVFWPTVAILFYTFLGYPLLMWSLAHVRRKAVRKRNLQPTVSVVMAVRNGGKALLAKLTNLRELDYPKELVEYIVASDGSVDETVPIITSARDVRTIVCPAVGKAEALNRAVTAARSEIVVFTDVRQQIEPSALSELVANFADERVGCVSGELMFRSAEGGEGVSAYWKFEKALRAWESASGSVMGATGALYAVRRSMIPQIPPGTILDDLYIPLQIIGEGKRVVFEPKARAWDNVAVEPRREFDRKVRTLAGNFQLLQLGGAALLRRGMFFRFVSHKLLRLAAPWLLLVALFSSWFLRSSALYLSLALAQTAVYAISGAAMLLPALRQFRFANIAMSFSLMNAASAFALVRYVRHRRVPLQLWTGSRENTANSTAASVAAQGQ
jgi:cellulose synthase/poly-beta-1,6-N-acetylglucosamine synthase-like glycosyltransferase